MDIGTEARSGLYPQSPQWSCLRMLRRDWYLSPDMQTGPLFSLASSVSLEISQPEFLLFISLVFVDKGARCFDSALAAHQGTQSGESWEGKHVEESGPGRSRFCLCKLG